MEESISKDNTGDNQFVIYLFLILGLVILATVMASVFFNSIWIPAVLSCTSMMIGSIVFLQMETRGKKPWLWSVGIFLIIPVFYFIIVSVTS